MSRVSPRRRLRALLPQALEGVRHPRKLRNARRLRVDGRIGRIDAADGNI
jgi:hypothetical protein